MAAKQIETEDYSVEGAQTFNWLDLEPENLRTK